MSSACNRCEQAGAELAQARLQIAKLSTDLDNLSAQLHEMTKLAELQAADLERYRKVVQGQAQPNRPERVPDNQVQLGLERILASITDGPTKDMLAANAEQNNEHAAKKRSSTPHGRRNLELAGLPVEEFRIVPDEVLASGREGWVLIGEERSDRLAFRRALFFCMRVVREKWVRPVADPMAVLPSSLIVTAAQPDYVWPNVMADPSVITDVILSKYDYLLPLNRQERQTRNRGFVIPRSTQSDWLSAAYELLRHVVDAMHADSIANSHCIATDATGAPVRALRQCLLWHVFVFISDRGHVTFRHSRRHTSKVILALLEGFTGRLLSDASSIYDALFRIGIIAVSCWAHYPESVVIRIACPISRQTRDRADFAPRIIRDLSHPSFAREMSQGRDPGSRVRRGSGSARRPVTHWTRRIGLCETLLLSRAGARFQSTCIGVPNS